MSDLKCNMGVKLVAPILVQTDIGEVEGRVGDYLVITAEGNQVVMSENEYLNLCGNETLRAPIDSGECNYPEIPDSSIPFNQSEKKAGGLRSVLGKLKPKGTPPRTVMSVAEEGFQEVPPLPDPAILEENLVSNDSNSSEIPNSSVQSSPPKKRGLLGLIFKRQKTDIGVESMDETLNYVPESEDGLNKFVPVPAELSDMDKERSVVGPGPETTTEPPKKMSFLDSIIEDLNLKTDSGSEQEGMTKIQSSEICHTPPAPAEPQCTGAEEAPAPTYLKASTTSPHGPHTLGTPLQKARKGHVPPFFPRTPETPPPLDWDVSKILNDIFCAPNLPQTPETLPLAEPDPEEEGSGVVLTNRANRDLEKLERAALANLAPPVKKKTGPPGFPFSGKKDAPSSKKGKKRSVVLPFQKKATTLVEPKKEKYEWVPIDWI